MGVLDFSQLKNPSRLGPPSNSMDKTLPSYVGGMGLIPELRTKFPHAAIQPKTPKPSPTKTNQQTKKPQTTN